MQTIVTGATGLVGGGLTQRIKGTVPMMGRADCDITKQEEILSWIKSRGIVGPVNLIHCAADPIVSRPVSELEAQIKNNVLAFYNMVEVLHAEKLLTKESRIVNISSASVYGNNKQIFHTSPVKPETYYGVTKLAAELVGMAFEHREGIKTVSVRPVAVVGPGARHGMVPDVADKVMKAYLDQSTELKLMSNSIKPFVHVSDLQDAIAALVRMPKECWASCHNFVNVGPEDNVSVENVVKAMWDYLCDQYGKKPLPVLTWEGSWKGDGKEIRYVTNVQARTFLGWKPAYTTSIDAVMAAARPLLEVKVISPNPLIGLNCK